LEKAQSITTHPFQSLPPSQRGNETLPELSTTSIIVVPLIFCIIAVSTYVSIFARKCHSPKSKSRRKIPCFYCQYFSGNPYLKCALHPKTVLTEKAADCTDYGPNSIKKRIEKWRKVLLAVSDSAIVSVSRLSFYDF